MNRVMNMLWCGVIFGKPIHQSTKNTEVSGPREFNSPWNRKSFLNNSSVMCTFLNMKVHSTSNTCYSSCNRYLILMMMMQYMRSLTHLRKDTTLNWCTDLFESQCCTASLKLQDHKERNHIPHHVSAAPWNSYPSNRNEEVLGIAINKHNRKGGD